MDNRHFAVFQNGFSALNCFPFVVKFRREFRDSFYLACVKYRIYAVNEFCLVIFLVFIVVENAESFSFIRRLVPGFRFRSLSR